MFSKDVLSEYTIAENRKSIRKECGCERITRGIFMVIELFCVLTRWQIHEPTFVIN